MLAKEKREKVGFSFLFWEEMMVLSCVFPLELVLVIFFPKVLANLSSNHEKCTRNSIIRHSHLYNVTSKLQKLMRRQRDYMI